MSNHSAAQLSALLAAAKTAGTTPPIGIEDYYTIAGSAVTPEGESRPRLLEREVFPVLWETGLGLLAFSPMDRGELAPGGIVAEGSPLAELLHAIDGAARQLQTSRGAVCVAWVLAQTGVTAVLGGAESPAHVDEMLDGVRLELPAEILESLNAGSKTYSRRVGTIPSWRLR